MLRETVKRRGFCLVATVLVAASVISIFSASANAQFWPWGGGGWEPRSRFGYYERDRRRDWDRGQRQRRQDKQAPSASGKAERDAAKAPEGPILAVVSLSSQRIAVYGRRGKITQSAVSTGMAGYRTPTGIFSVIQKNRYHESNIYSGAPMPWMQRLTWSGIALHGGVVPRYPASHGCIRLPHEFAARMWDMTRISARVVVSPYDVEPISFSHPALPVPALTTRPADPVAETVMGPPTLEMASTSSTTLTDGRAETITNVEGPQRRARAARTAAAANARAAEKALGPAQLEARNRSAEAARARVELRRAQAAVATSEARLADLTAQGASEEAETAARDAESAAKARLAEMIDSEARASDAAMTAATAAKEAQGARETTAELLKSAPSAQDPVSVFVSAKEGRIFLRQGFTPLMDAPITIRDTGERLGTHIFTAISTLEDGSSVEWLAVTVPDGGAEGRMDAMRDRQLKKAQEALDRIEIPTNIRTEIANRLWAGASLIVSDHGLNHETGRGTDFVVLTK